jgi:hypothetical protein
MDRVIATFTTLTGCRPGRLELLLVLLGLDQLVDPVGVGVAVVSGFPRPAHYLGGRDVAVGDHSGAGGRRRVLGGRAERRPASLRAKPAFGLLLMLGACRFALTGIYQGSLGGGPVIATVAGWIGLPLAVFALYGGLALMLEDSAQRTVLPIGRRGRTRASLEGTLAHQIDAAEREAGVRRQLLVVARPVLRRSAPGRQGPQAFSPRPATTRPGAGAYPGRVSPPMGARTSPE